MDQPNQARRTGRASRIVRGAALGLALLLSACSSDSDGAEGPQGPSTTNQFAVDSSNVINGATWQLNRPIEITFNKDIDFTTVSQTTIQIVDGQGVPAIGSFTQLSSRRVRFQPVCPTNATNTNGGLLQGRNYRLTIPSESTPGIGGGLTVQSTSGERLVNGLALNFTTPSSTDPLVLFVDQQPGAPAVRVRGLGVEPIDSLAGSYVEFPGLDDDGDGEPDREYLVFDPLAQQGNIGREVPLNFYSDPTQQFAFVLRFNQAVFAAPSNINTNRLSIEYFNQASGIWETVPATVELLSNCTTIGAEVRLAPEGIVPQGSEIRAVVREGFADLTNDAVPAALTNFARVESSVANPGAMNPGDGADGITEQFDVGGDAAGSREDTEIASANPRANWNSGATPGTLTASFDFGGTGGPAGEFDWVISGVDLIISTDADIIQGGPDGTPIYQQPIIGGLINVRDLRVEANASITFVGSNTVTILATGEVEILGDVIVNGADSRGVGTLNTTNQPEPGAPGNGGGGDGGIGSFQTNQSTARGGTGQGAFGVPGLGGQGGETGFAQGGTCAKEDRRGAGGGGGNFGRDIMYLDSISGLMARCQMLVGMDGERGIVGSFDGTGAVSQTLPAQGGELGPDPFTDPNQDNDFFGVITLSDGRQIRGELPSLWAGAGGGAGGDASRVNNFPQTPFQPTGDEKGSGGGGGAGGIEILAIGDISILGQGQLTADGGTGNGGENSIFFDRIGGGSGGGSGGHIVLSSANRVIIESEATNNVGAFYDDAITTLSHVKRPVRALGGQNGAGRESECGANEDGEKGWARDSIPEENFGGNLDVPPNSSTDDNGVLNWARRCSTNGSSGNFAACQQQPNRGETFGAGGDGAPGIIQLHVSDPSTQLLFGAQGGGTYGVNADPTFSMAPPPFGWSAPADPVDLLVPFFSARSESFTEWIPLGLARLNPNGTTDQVEFIFDGTDPLTGVVERAFTVAEELDPLIDYTGLTVNAGGGGSPSVDPATGTFTFPDGSFVANPTIDDFYRANAALLEEFAVRIRDNGNAATETEFIIQAASYDAAAGEFTVVVDTRDILGDTLSGFAVPEVELVPYFFRLRTASVLDEYPSGTEVAILFDAARLNPATGEPSTNPAEIFSGGDTAAFTPDITDLNNDVWDFVRVKFEFLIDIDDLGAPRPGLDFIKIPFRF